MEHHKDESFLGGIVKALGLVFGDIGTSPIYTLTVIFTLTQPTRENVFGILSLVFWTMTILVTMEYAWLAMSLGRKGQGGEIVLREIIMKLVKAGRLVAFGGFLSFVGVSLLLGDAVITPAISILSAVEGLHLIPGLEGLSTGVLVAIAATIAIGLFSVQYKGTDRVASAFGPIMALWFGTLAVTGVVSALSMPEIVEAINPWHAFTFFRENGLAGYFVLSEVILCATGGEALYADMGHLGKRPIIRAWHFVFVALYLNYLGQGVFAITNPGAKNLLFGMVQSQAPALYIPFLFLTIMATIIASQAIISGVFSIVYQGITTRLLPLMRVDYTSREIKSQIYLGAVNWSLLAAVIFIMLVFRKSENLAAAYGMAVTGSMTITGIMMVIVFAHTTKKWRALVALAVTVIAAAYHISTYSKLPHGAYWSIVLASIPFVTIIIWTRGQRSLYHALKPLDLETFLLSYEQIYAKGPIRGTGLFFTRETDVVPPYVVHCIIRSNIIYERNVFISLVITEEPLGVETELIKGIGPGLDAFRIEAGYMEMVDIEGLLKANGIQEKVIFYGVEDIATRNPVWRVFSVFKKLTPNFVQFHKLPASRLQGVVTRVEM